MSSLDTFCCDLNPAVPPHSGPRMGRARQVVLQLAQVGQLVDHTRWGRRGYVVLPGTFLIPLPVIAAHLRDLRLQQKM